MKIKYENRMDKNLVELFVEAVHKFPDHIIYKYKQGGKKFNSITYKGFLSKVEQFAAGLDRLKLSYRKMGIISDTCVEWMIAVLANMGLNGIDIPRGNNTSDNELSYIFDHVGINFVCLQNKDSYKKYEKLNKSDEIIKIIFDDNGLELKNNEYTFNDICGLGKEKLKNDKDFFLNNIKNIDQDDVCTIIYTSGTTGNPKGVMLTHKNLVYAPTEVPKFVTAYHNDRWMSILPVWHVGERFFEFMGIIHGITIILSDVYSLRTDMKNQHPHLIPGVPLVWKKSMKGILKGIEDKGKLGIFNFFYSRSLAFLYAKRILKGTNLRFKRNSLFLIVLSAIKLFFNLPFHLLGHALVYKKIIEATGGSLRIITSGGGKLPNDVEDFYAVMGISIIDGYGATETAVLVTIREDNDVAYTIGRIMPGTEYKIIDPETNQECKKGTGGLLHVRGEQVFKGYYNNDKGTRAVFDADGWYNTGDLVKESITGHLQYVGRIKDTIVLLNGENVEPEPIEESIEDSDYINHAVIYGQDMESLSALIIPNLDSLNAKFGPDYFGNDIVVKERELSKFIKDEIKKKISTKTGFSRNELVKNFVIINDSLEVGIELTNTMKKRRDIILQKYNNYL